MTERLGALLYVDEWEKVEGAPWPLGVTWVESRRAFNFALFSRHATGVTLLLYIENDPANPVCRYWRENVQWSGTTGGVDFSPDSRSLAYLLRGTSLKDNDLYVMINAHWDDLVFTIQEGQASEWRRVVDTGLPSPDDIAEPGRGYPLASLQYPVKARSIVVLER